MAKTPMSGLYTRKLPAGTERRESHHNKDVFIGWRKRRLAGNHRLGSRRPRMALRIYLWIWPREFYFVWMRGSDLMGEYGMVFSRFLSFPSYVFCYIVQIQEHPQGKCVALINWPDGSLDQSYRALEADLLPLTWSGPSHSLHTGIYAIYLTRLPSDDYPTASDFISTRRWTVSYLGI